MIFIILISAMLFILLAYYIYCKVNKIIYIIKELDKVDISNEEKKRISFEYTRDLFHPIVGEKIFGKVIKFLPKMTYNILKKKRKINK